MPKGITDEQRLRLRDTLMNEVKPRFASDSGSDWQTAAAQRLGVAQSTLSRLAAEKPQGGSLSFAEKLGTFLNKRPDAILNGKDDEEMPRLSELPGYEDALERAMSAVKEQRRTMSLAELRGAGDYRMRPTPGAVTAELLLAIAALHTERAPIRKKPHTQRDEERQR